MAWANRGPTVKETLGGLHPATTWVLLTGRVLTQARGLTGGTTHRVDVDHRTLMEARTSTAEERKDGDLDQDTRDRKSVV